MLRHINHCSDIEVVNEEKLGKVVKTSARRLRREFVLYMREHVVKILKFLVNKIRSKMLTKSFGLRYVYFVSTK